ncbi:MAG: ABC transporter permease subunit [Streptosporangiales bacterium]|nr:ABC transporter permease subunit [Streptosporangiales bacterium]
MTTTPPVTGVRADELAGTSLRGPRLLLAGVWGDRNGRVGVVIVGALVLLAIVGLAGVFPYSPTDQDPAVRLAAPSGAHWFGTDQFGRDIAVRTLVGIATSLRVAFVAVALACVVGSALGITAGFFRGWWDQVVGRAAEVLFAFPAILLALAVVSALGRGWLNTALAIAIVYTPIFVRVSRGPTLTVATSEYVKAGRVLGIPVPRLLLRHVLPGVAAPIVVQLTLALSWAVLTESALSFLGLGTQPPDPSLGLMVSDARNIVADAWWSMAFPAAAVVLAVIGLNLVGDGLRTALEERR